MIAYLFYGLFFFVPLVLFPQSSELFEFNKLVAVYIFTVLITAAWLSRCLVTKKFIFRRTTLDVPILIFLSAITLSTIFSIDVRTSILGYYSRFHGGLLSYLCYSLLYWAYVSNMDRRKTLTSVYCLLSSAVLVSVYGVLQHFGVDKNIWIQDVQNRIFSSLGQPNWLAGWIVALTPFTWAFALSTKYKVQSTKFWLWPALSALFFITLLFTKSRSGLLGFAVADILFWSFTFLKIRRKAFSSFLIHNSLFLLLALAIGTPFTSKVIVAPETGGTESGQIRKIVWKGAINLWKKYPVLGTGPETFAYSYYETRLVEHNLVSEWDFLYNKAHNEYLNFAATTGSVGLIAYLLLIGATIKLIIESGIRNQVLGKTQNSEPLFIFHQQGWPSFAYYSLFAGYISILITNFFGFSVVPVAILFFMFPAFAVSMTEGYKVEDVRYKFSELAKTQKLLFLCILIPTSYILFLIISYWRADFLYAKGRLYNDNSKYDIARNYLARAVKLSPNESVFWGELSRASVGLAEKNPELAEISVSESQKAVSLSPRNLNLQRNMASVFIKLAGINPNYLRDAQKVTEDTIFYAPTDAKLYYNLGLTTYRLGETEKALAILDKAIQLKSDYKNARFAKALILIGLGRKREAKEELTYILEKIDANDTLVKQELKKI